MKKTAVTLVALLGLLSPAVSEGAKITLLESEVILHDMSKGGIFYGSGREHLRYNIVVEKSDVVSQEPLIKIAQQLEEKIYDKNSCHPNMTDIKEDFIYQNTRLFHELNLVARYLKNSLYDLCEITVEFEYLPESSLSLKEGDVLRYDAYKTIGSGVNSIL